MYKGGILATPQKSAVPAALTTIAGGGGRGDIVVEHNEPVQPEAAEDTLVPQGRPEPGHDYFAKGKEKVIPSGPPPPQQNQVYEEKEVVSVLPPPVSEGAADEEAAEELGSTMAQPPPGATSYETAPLDGHIEASTSTEILGAESEAKGEEMKAAAAAEAGPVAEGDAEADRVAADLFPDA